VETIFIRVESLQLLHEGLSSATLSREPTQPSRWDPMRNTPGSKAGGEEIHGGTLSAGRFDFAQGFLRRHAYTSTRFDKALLFVSGIDESDEITSQAPPLCEHSSLDHSSASSASSSSFSRIGRT